MFLVNMLDADNKLLSADDITAAETAPRPMNDTATGVRYSKTMGRINACSFFSSGLLSP